MSALGADGGKRGNEALTLHSGEGRGRRGEGKDETGESSYGHKLGISVYVTERGTADGLARRDVHTGPPAQSC